MKSLCCSIIALVTMTSCSQTETIPHPHTFHGYQEIKGRDNEMSHRLPVYRVKVPANWERQDHGPEESVKDTTKSLVSYSIHQNGETIKITIHNFPYQQLSQRIPSHFQVDRWQKQFSYSDPTSTSISPESFSGFYGHLFENTGIQHGKEITIYAWAMELASEHDRSLVIEAEHYPNKALKVEQMRANFTIKAQGPKQLMHQYKKQIFSFARSFELIDELPTPNL